MAETLHVYLHDAYLGRVTRAGRDMHRVAFVWDPSYEAGPVTLTESFSAAPGVNPSVNAVSNFFGGYAPEGTQRAAIADRRGLDANDLFGLLREFGGSIAGAVTFHPDTPRKMTPAYALLNDREVSQRLLQAVEQHDLGIQDDSRSMLPGFQPKLLLARFGNDWYAPHGRAHSTHILKPQLASRPDAVYNEFYGHELARWIGLASSSIEVLTAAKTTYLSIERYDRIVNGTHVALAHQEDFAQALGLDWRSAAFKFQDADFPSRPGRPSNYLVAELTGSIASTADLQSEWLRQLIFHVLIGNNDAHAKNIGLMHRPGDTTLTEIYDAVPNLYQEDRINWDMAMAIDGVFDHRRISVERISAEAASWAVIPSKRIDEIVGSSLHRFGEALAAVTPPASCTDGLPERLQWNHDRLANGNEISTPKRR